MANRVTWAPSPDINIATYSVARGPAAIGPWTPLATIDHNTSDPSVYDSAIGKFYYVDTPGTGTDWYRLIATDSFAQDSQPAYFQAAVPPAAPVASADYIVEKVGSEVDGATYATASYDRTEPLITPDQLKDRFLVGIPLVAATPDPITKKRKRITDEMLRDAIARAASQVELDVGVKVTPMRFRKRLPFDRAEYHSLGFFRLPDVPILRIRSLEVRTPDSQLVYNVPVRWADPGQFRKGQVNIIPIMPAFAAGGGTLPSFDGGAAFLSILGQAGWVASYWEIEYEAGLDQGHIPLNVNQVIGTYAAMDIIRLVAQSNRVQSYSTGLDSASQSVSTGGAALYDTVLQKLEEERKRLVQRLKGFFGRKFIVDNI